MENKEINMRDIGKIEICIMKNDIELLKKLLNEHQEYLNYADSFIGTFLHVAAKNGNIEGMKCLLRLGIDINKCAGGFDANALVSAISSNQFEAAKYLLDAGIEIDTSTSLRNPLISAIYHRNAECVKLLIEKGIDVNITYNRINGEQLNALSHAHTYGTDEIIDIIEKEVNKTGGNQINTNNYDNKVTNYIEKYLGNIDETIREILPGSKVSININIIRPTKERNYITLVTSGMSEYSMGYSENDEENKYAELMMKLPPDWKLDESHCKSDTYGCPLRILRMIGHLPHNSEGYISERVIIPNGIQGDVPLPFHADTWLSAIMICKSEDIPSLNFEQNKRIDFFTVVPICDEEIELARKMGNNKFMNTLPMKDIVDEKRGFEE